jgi:hypothetical protein
MDQEYPHRPFSMHRIRFDRGVAGLVFVIGCIALFLASDPFWLFAAAIAFGLLIAIVLHFLHRSATPNLHDDGVVAQEYPHQGITMHRIRFGGGFAGLLFTVGCMALFLVGLPVLWYPFVGALAMGVAIATALHFLHH